MNSTPPAGPAKSKFLVVRSSSSLCLLLLGGLFLPGGKAIADDVPDFTDAPIYEIGEIPFQTVWHGQKAKFRVRATALGTGTPVSAGYVNPPSGTIFFDSGNFLYRPGMDDKAEFTVTFYAGVGPNRLEQIVPIQPIPLLPPEGDLLGVERKGVPDPTSRDYLVISDLKNTGTTSFNHAQRQLRTVTISGKEVDLSAGHANRLFESYQNNEDILEFHINTEKLTIAGPFHLPSTKIVIRARHIDFQDIGGQTSYISTQPIDYLITPSETNTPGGIGLSAGDLEVYAESIAVPPVQGGQPARFVTRGGTGQNGAPGANGTPGPNYKPTRPTRFTEIARRVGLPSTEIRNSTTGIALDSDRNAEWDVFTSVSVGDPRTEILQADNKTRSVVNSWVVRGEWRPDGGNGKPGGDPGNGGHGGRVKSNLSAALELTDSSGGLPGSTPAFPGGNPGTPSPAYFYIATDKLPPGSSFEQRVFELAATHIAKRGNDAPAKTGAVGVAGAAMQNTNALAWLSPQALRQVVNHVSAAYLDGEQEFVHSVATDYLVLLGQLRASTEWSSVPTDQQRDYALLEEEFTLMAHRVTSGLDYFGNPPGWVPLLSLEANKLAFEQEIDRAIGILYLEYWLSDVGVGLQNKIGALTDARNNLAAESEKLAQNFEVANNLLPNLKLRVQAIETETAAVQKSLKLLEAELLRDAKDKLEEKLKVPLWRRVARGLATIAKMIPHPAAQGIGAGLDVAANFNSEKPWESIEGIQDVISTYKNGSFDQKAKDLNAEYKKIKFPDLPQSADPNAINGFIGDVQKASKPIVDSLKDVQKAFQGTQAPRSQIEAELARLKAECKEFKQLGSRISQLMGEKEAFVQQISQTIQLLGGLSENITGNLLAMDALNEGYAQAAGALDDRALMYLKEIGRRARERLLLYHYYVKKAYEYRLLRPYPGRLDLQKLFDNFRDMAGQSGGTYKRLTGEQFRELRGVYDDALGELIKEVVVEYNRNAPALSAPRRLSLTEEELSRLNAGDVVVLDLRTVGGTGLFPRSEENLRIANIRVLRLGLNPVNNSQDGDEVSLYIEHAGASIIHTTANNRPRSYRFVHYTEDTEVPVQWGVRYFPKAGDLLPITRSLATDSLLGALLQKSGTNPRDAGYFTYLGGLAELRLKKSQTAASGTILRLNEVVLEIEYEFVRRGSSLRSLEFITADGLVPYVEISTPDLSGRQGGLGSFERVYANNAQVTVSAPDRIGNLRFAGFFDFNHNAPADFDGANHQLTMSMSDDRRVEARYVAVEELQLGISGNPASGFLKLSLDGERYTPFRLEAAPQLQGPWLPLLDGTLITPEEHTIPTTGNDAQFYRLRVR